MLRPATLVPIIAAAASLAAVGLLPGASVRVAARAPAQTGESIAIADCTEVAQGDSFSIAISVDNVSNLAAWEVYFAYDRDIVEVTGKDVRVFLSQRPNSNVFDFSDPVPNTDGIYRLAAADLGREASAESGSGVLATVTLKALTKGVSAAAVFRGDADGDGSTDLGPTLTGSGGKHIGDANGDAVFDGPISSGQIAVGRGCAEPPPTPIADDIVAVLPAASTAAPGSQTPSADGGGNTPGPSPQPAGSTATPTPEAPGRTPGPASGTPTSVSNGGDDGGGPGAWLIGALGAGAAAMLGVAFFILRSARRPA